jgi:putative membrane protein
MFKFKMTKILSQISRRAKAMRSGEATRASQSGDVLKGLAAGLVAGLIASWTMNRFQAMWSRQQVGVEKPHGAQGIKPYVEGQGIDESDESDAGKGAGPGNKQQDDPAEKVAQAVTESVLDRDLKEHEKEPAGEAVHYVFGTGAGAFYGALAEVAPAVTAGAGLPFGALFWLVADEATVPALGLARKPTEYPLSTHAYSLCSHLVYALTAEAVRRTVRRAL